MEESIRAVASRTVTCLVACTYVDLGCFQSKKGAIDVIIKLNKQQRVCVAVA